MTLGTCGESVCVSVCDCVCMQGWQLVNVEPRPSEQAVGCIINDVMSPHVSNGAASPSVKDPQTYTHTHTHTMTLNNPLGELE